MRRWLVVGCLGVALLGMACGSDGGDGDSDEEERGGDSSYREVALNEPVVADASELRLTRGERGENSGEISVTFLGAEFRSVLDSACGEENRAKGTFVLVFYEVQNDTNAEIVPDAVGTTLVLFDDNGREWDEDLTHDYTCFGSAAAAEVRGYEGPGEDMGPGFGWPTAVLFDAPEGTTGLAVRWPELEVEVGLGLPEVPAADPDATVEP